jgi:hypothetical protein
MHTPQQAAAAAAAAGGAAATGRAGSSKQQHMAGSCSEDEAVRGRLGWLPAISQSCS